MPTQLVQALVVDKTGEVTVAGQAATCAGSMEEIDLAGDELWHRNFPSPGCSVDFGAEGLAVQSDHAIVATFYTPNGGYDFGTGAMTATNVLASFANGAPPVAYDHFSRTGALGSNWRITHGAWADNGSAAYANGAQNYAVWATTAPADSAASAIIT